MELIIKIKKSIFLILSIVLQFIKAVLYIFMCSFQENNSYIHNGFVPETEDEPPNHYEILKQKIWNIPRNFLDVQSDILGWGQYSNVVKGTVRQRGFPIGVMIQAIDGKQYT